MTGIAFKIKENIILMTFFYTGAGSYMKLTSYKLGPNFELETAVIGKL